MRSFGWLGSGLVALVSVSCGPEMRPAEVSFDRLELVVRFRMLPGGGPETYEAADDDDGPISWVEAFATPDRGSGIFLAEGRIRVRVPQAESAEMRVEELTMRLITDDYTQSGWLRGALLTFIGEGRAELSEQASETNSFWRVVHMPRLVLTDAAHAVRGEFDWIAEPPTEAMTPEVWFDSGDPSPTLYVHFVRYRRAQREAEP